MNTFLKVFYISFAVSILTCAQAYSGNKKAGKMVFIENEHNFGLIHQGAAAEFIFVFRNVGNEPIVINHVQSSCGCTIPEWSKEPVGKNQTGAIKVNYNTNILGNFRKTILVHSNAINSPVTLTVKGTVVAVKESNLKE